MAVGTDNVNETTATPEERYASKIVSCLVQMVTIFVNSIEGKYENNIILSFI